MFQKKLKKCKCGLSVHISSKALLKGSLGFLKRVLIVFKRVTMEDWKRGWKEENFKRASKVQQQSFKRTLREFQDNFKCSKKLLWKRASRELQESFKIASRELQESFKIASRELQESFKFSQKWSIIKWFYEFIILNQTYLTPGLKFPLIFKEFLRFP